MAQAASASAQRAAARRKQRTAGTRPKRRTPSRSGIRWDRVARAALLGTLGIVLMLYISPLHRWLTQHNLASQQSAELHQLQVQNKQLRSNIKRLHNSTALEIEARKLGMVRRGEREYVVRDLPNR